MKDRRKIAVVTATRAEYGLLKNTIKKIDDDDDLELMLWVTGSHLSSKYGMTISEIKEDGLPIDEQIPIIPLIDRIKESGRTERAEDEAEEEVIETLSNASKMFGNLIIRKKPDMLLVLGDRYELLPICNVATVLSIPIAHISGGEITEGAIDDIVRHSITKMSTLHFPGCEEYRKRIIQMGEEPDRVFNYGDVGIENIKKTKLLSREKLAKELKQNFDSKLDICGEKKFALLTYHPVTTEKGSAREQANNLFETIKGYEDITFIVTKANADAEGNIINEIAKEYADKCANIYLFSSLGITRYLSALSMCQFVIGNSSSGIVEAPAFGVPTVNIGNRQKGRLRAESIIDCDNSKESIKAAIDKALSKDFKAKAKNAINPYGDGETSTGIVKEIKNYLFGEHSETSKKFYDINYKL